MIDNPQRIEQLSFEIIERELQKKIPLEFEPTIKRIIHATADFEYAQITEIHHNAIASGIEAIKSGHSIYADTNMVYSGIHKQGLEKCGARVYALVSDDSVIREARTRGITRSIVAIEKACADHKTKVFVIGNAPTALDALKKSIDRGEARPLLIIGVPVGFVGAAESKEEIKKTGIPYIITRGRKGGSTVAVAIVNSLIYQM